SATSPTGTAHRCGVGRTRGAGIQDAALMPVLSLHLRGDGAFERLQAAYGDSIVAPNDIPIEVAVLKAGMQSGKPSVAFGIVLPDGHWVFAETSLALFLTAADA